MAVLSVRTLPGTDDVLRALGSALPQPDQLCGPFAAWAALHSVVAAPPAVTDLAVASGTRVWPHDVPAWRPAGARLDRTGWDRVPRAASIDDGGTEAAGLAGGIAALCPEVGVVPAAGPGDVRALMVALLDLDRPLGVVANLRTGPVAPPGPSWDVGHFVVLWGVDGERVAVADSYAELGAPGLPAGCRLVAADALEEALAERGLLLLTHAEDGVAVGRLVAAAGFGHRPWGRLG